MAEKKEPKNLAEQMKLAEEKAQPKRKIYFSMMSSEDLEKSEDSSGLEILEKSVINSFQDIEKGKKVTRLSFNQDPTTFNKYLALYRPKTNLIPDYILKRLSVRDSLVAAIVNARANQISSFGRELQDRFSAGFRIEPRRGIMNKATPEQKTELEQRISETVKILVNCGSTEGVAYNDLLSFHSYLYQQARNAVVFGRIATEITKIEDLETGEEKFHSFRPIDVGTIFPAAPKPDQLDNVRKQALYYLEQMKNEKLRPEKFDNDEYAWVQVIQGFPRQAFAPDELIVHTLTPVTDIEYGGYPVTPMDAAIDEILTHMNITNHNKLYFASGRAARGMVVIKSADINQDIADQIRQHFNASINSVQNSWRVPVFGIDMDEEVKWEPLEMQAGRDMEFQYLADNNARAIFSTFQMSPEEVPGYQHLSRGTNNQGLSESNTEYKLEAARDTGIRPLLAWFQDFVNDYLLPLIDPLVSKLCVLKFYGLDADTPEKENARQQMEQALHGTYDESRNIAEKNPIGIEWGGEFPLNPGMSSILDAHFSVGEIEEHFMKRVGASKNPDLKYRRDPFWFNWQQLQMQMKQMEQQQQAMAMQPQGGQEEGGEGSQGGEEEGQGEKSGDGELAQKTDELSQKLGKNERGLSPANKRILAKHKATVKAMMDGWEQDSEKALDTILKVVKVIKPKE